EDTPPVEIAPAAAPPRAALRRRAVVAAGLMILIAAGAAWRWRAAGPRESSPPVHQARGIAVLPFDNLGEAEQAYFAAGVTEEVTLQLAKVGALRVLSRSAVARFKDPAAQLSDMTRELGIGAVLT